MMKSLRVRQLDSRTRPLQAEILREVPTGGWIRLIRTALGMSMRQLAERAGVAKNSVAQAENSEARNAIQLDTLQSMADAMDCDLVYALVPRTSLQATLRSQAYKKASRLLGRVSDSMTLDDITEEILRTRGWDFWDD